MGVNKAPRTGGRFFRTFDPPVRVDAMHDRRHPWGHELFIPAVWEVCRVKPIGLGRPYKVAETNDEQAALQHAMEEHQRLAAETEAAAAGTRERLDRLFGDCVQVHLQLTAGCWITAYRIGDAASPEATDQLRRYRRLETSPAEVIDMYCPAGCGKFRGTRAQWAAHDQEHARVRGMGRAGLAEALEMARRAGDPEGVALYTATWREEIGGDPPNATGDTHRDTAPNQ
jgi:hypothetical protein